MSAVKRRKQKLGAGDRAFNIVLGGLTAVSVVAVSYTHLDVYKRQGSKAKGERFR